MPVILYYRQLIRNRRNLLRVFIIYSRDRAKELPKALFIQNVWGMEIIGYLDPAPAAFVGSIDAIPIIGSVHDITAFLGSLSFQVDLRSCWIGAASR